MFVISVKRERVPTPLCVVEPVFERPEPLELDEDPLDEDPLDELPLEDEPDEEEPLDDEPDELEPLEDEPDEEPAAET